MNSPRRAEDCHGPTAPAPEAAPPSLDEQIKALQLQKLQAEVKHLNGVSVDAIAKVLITVLGLAAAGWSLYIGLIKAQSDLIDSREKVMAQTKLLATRSAELASAEQELKARQIANTELEARRGQMAAEYERLKKEVRDLSEKASLLAAGQAQSKGAVELREQLQQAAKPTVFIQFAGGINRDAQIEPLRQKIAAAGFNVPAAERIDRGQSNQVRYFADNETERSQAQKIADTVGAYFRDAGCPLSINVRYVENKNGKRSPPEVWLMHNCPAQP